MLNVIEAYNTTLDKSYQEDTWCSDYVLSKQLTHQTYDAILASHVRFFRPCILVFKQGLNIDNFAVIDVLDNQIKDWVGDNFADLSDYITWIEKNKQNIIDCWSSQNTLTPVKRDYHFDDV